MRVIAKRTLREFWELHADSEQPLKAWHREISQSQFISFNELKRNYPSASILKEKRAVFNIKGNHYRLVVRMNFEAQLCRIRFVGTHEEYNKIDANKV